MHSAKSSLVVGLVLFLNIFLSAQNLQITYQTSDSLFVCGSDTIFIQLQNQFSTPLTDAVVQVSLPAGLQYETGSIQGATELNITNLSAPTFKLPAIGALQTHPFFLRISAQCEAADLLDAGQFFKALISLNSSLGNPQVLTTSILVETGALVIESVTPQVLSGERGDTLYRTICFKNTRLGKIGNLHFQDAHQDGFEAFVENADVIQVSNGLVRAEYGGNLFATTGNGDHWLDLDEKVCITERIIITDCGTPPSIKSSLLRAGWGCDTTWCRYDSLLTQVQIKTSTRIPNLEFTQIWSPPVNFCGDQPVLMGFLIHNTGKVAAENVVFNVTMTEGQGQAGIVPGSIKLIGASGTNPISPSLSTSGLLAECGKIALSSGNFSIPIVPAKDSVKFVFDVYTCVGACGEVFPTFKANYLYTKACPTGSVGSGTAVIAPDTGYVVRAWQQASIGDCMEDGQSYSFHWNAKGRYLLEDGFIHLRMNFPKGITLDPTCNPTPNQVVPDLVETSFDTSGRQIVHFAWGTPLNVDTITFSYCIRFDCDSSIVCEDPPLPVGLIFEKSCCFITMTDVTYWTPALGIEPECGISDCGNWLLSVDCPGGGGGDGPFPPIPGVAISFKNWWSAYRKNPDWEDATDDRRADLPLTHANTNWRKDRFLPGDTLRVEFCGTVDSAFAIIDSFAYVISHSVRTNNMGQNDNDFFDTENARFALTDTNKIVSLGTSIRIKYADGQEATCSYDEIFNQIGGLFFRTVLPNTFPPLVTDEVSMMLLIRKFPLAILAAEGCLPKPNMVYGDSIFIFDDFKINSNFTPLSSNFPDPPLVGLTTVLTDRTSELLEPDTTVYQLQYSGWQMQTSPSQNAIKPCVSSTEPKQFRRAVRIARENMFPFEVRPLSWISDYRQTNPEGLELASASIEYLTLQDSTPWISNLALPFSQFPLDLKVDFSPAYADPIDEGYTLKTRFIFNPDCLFTLPDSSLQFIETSYPGCLNGDVMSELDTLKNPIGYFANTPRFNFTAVDSVVNSPTRAFEFDFTLKNVLVSPAPFAWIYLDAPSGLVNQLQLIQMPQNQPIAGNNGFFGLNQFPGNTSKNFRIKGENLSCNTDSLFIYFGWTCNPIQQISDASCGIDTILIKLNLERPELELDVHQEPNPLNLCETSDWFEFEVYNAKFGYAYELLSTLKLPPGLEITPGSCQISYPEGAPWVNIPNPQETNSNFYEWQVSDLLPAIAANGLPGFNQAPQNSYRIRFKVTAQCGFVANTPIVYGTTAIEPCGRQANLLNKQGEALQINGLTTPYGVVLNLQPVGNEANTCGDIQEIQVNMQLLGTPSATDSIYITLPQGVVLVNNSYVPGQNAPAGPVTLNGTGFQLPLPILQGGGVVDFKFKVQYSGLAGCSDKTLQAQTRVRTEAFCSTLGAPCVVYLATGEGIFTMNIKRPLLVITDANFALNNGSTTGSITLTNNGEAASEQATVNFWKDINGNGLLDANDLLLGSFNSVNPIAPGATINLEGLVSGLDSTEWCDLLIQLPAEPNCMCNEQIYKPEQWQVAHTPMQFCAPQTVTVGVPEQSGYTYTWLANPGISCVNCGTTNFTPTQSTPLNEPITLVLTETTGSCTIRHEFEISFSSSASILASDINICRGQLVTLTAQPDTGAFYQWSGQGISNPNQPIQIVQPDISGSYTVVVSFANGCTAAHTIDIAVLNADTVVLAGLATCPGVPIAILGNVTETPGTYQLLLSNSQGCDSLVFQSLSLIPPVQTVENFTFCLGDTLKNVLDTFFTTSGQVCRTYQGLNGCDSVHCALVTAIDPPEFPVQDTLLVDYGQIITLEGPTGFETYWWIPAPNPPCDDCPQVNFPADSAAYQEFRLRVTDANGCPGELIFRVLVLPPCSADSLHIPNAFTPNGDGANDVFRVVPHEGSEVISSLEIYNRWGQKIYENYGNSSWDGTINGEQAVSDVYVYIVTVKCGELVGKRVGDVTLLR